MRSLQSRLVSFATVCTSLICFFGPKEAAADLNAGYWQISGSDNRGVSWNGSKLHFLTDSPNGGNHSLSGYFEWTSDRGEFGRENFAGTLFSNNHLSLDGTAIVQPASGIITAHYEADLTPLGTQLINGSWTNGIPGVWSAVLVPVPEPENYAMLLAGLGLLGCMSRLRKTGKTV